MRGLAGLRVSGDRVTVVPHLSASLPAFSAETETLYGKLKIAVTEKEIVVTLPCGMKGTLVLEKEYRLEAGENRIER